MGNSWFFLMEMHACQNVLFSVKREGFIDPYFVSFTHLLCKNESLRPKNVSYITNILELSPEFSV
jgi:hypothetical protein